MAMGEEMAAKQGGFGVKALDALREAVAVWEAHKKIILCPDILADRVRAVLAEHGVSGLYEVIVSPVFPNGYIAIMDKHMMDDFFENWQYPS